ncbi:MAG: hypothetical protein ACI8R4_003722, partial [Paracoccaceae bacterium]
PAGINAERPHTALDKRAPDAAYLRQQGNQESGMNIKPDTRSFAANPFRKAGPLQCAA